MTLSISMFFLLIKSAVMYNSKQWNTSCFLTFFLFFCWKDFYSEGQLMSGYHYLEIFLNNHWKVKPSPFLISNGHCWATQNLFAFVMGKSPLGRVSLKLTRIYYRTRSWCWTRRRPPWTWRQTTSYRPPSDQSSRAGKLCHSCPQCCGAGRSWTFLLEPEPVKKLRLRAVAVWLRGSVVSKRQFL